jgi:two-component system chemotaxis sensor kinase CheA
VILEDDGAGIDRRKIQEKAMRLGMPAVGEKLSDDELFRLIFTAGFSTVDSVTDLSGRGVGLDVVRRNIDRLRGAVDVSSEDGKGTKLTIRMPLTLSIIDGFAVRVGGDTFVIPMDNVTECAELALEDSNRLRNGIFNLRGDAVPYVRLREAFGSPGPVPERENLVIVVAGGLRAGIVVDRLLGSMQAVIKPMGKVFREVSGFAGSTILGDGRVGLIIDVPELLDEVTKSNFEPQRG